MPEGQVLDNKTVDSEVKPDATTTATVESQNGQANAQGASVEEKFSAIDPQTLPQELQAHYKSMQADYTKGKQALAKEQTRIKELEEKATKFDEFSSNKEFVDQWNTFSKKDKAAIKADAEDRIGDEISDEEFAGAFKDKGSFIKFLRKTAKAETTNLEKKVAEQEQIIKTSKAAEFIDSFAEEVDDKGEKIHADFYELDDDKLITGYLQLNPPQSEKEWAKALKGAYEWASALKGKYYEKGKGEALGIVQKKSQGSTLPPTNSQTQAYSGPDPKTLSVADAIALAKKGIRVPQS